METDFYNENQNAQKLSAGIPVGYILKYLKIHYGPLLQLHSQFTCVKFSILKLAHRILTQNFLQWHGISELAFSIITFVNVRYKM